MPRRNFLRDESAATTTEYAIVIVLIAAGLILASDAVRLATETVFRKTSVALGPAAAAGTSSGGTSSSTAASAPAPGVAEVAAAIPLLHFVAWVVLVGAAGFVAYARNRRQSVLQSLRERQCGPEPVAEEPSNPNFQKRQQIQRVLLKHFDEALHSQIEVRHVMSRTVRTVEPTTDMFALREVMEQEGFRHLLVMEGENLLGVISDRDVKSRNGRLARNVMTTNPLSVTPGTQLSHAMTMLLHRRISCLPVVEAGKLRGILTTTDMLMTLQCLMNLLDRAHATAASEQSGEELAALGA